MQLDPKCKGARFYKCDLQMQTPADSAHWLGAPMGEIESDKQAAAEAYIKRCYEFGLEVIAITDHNFASKDFIPYLQQAISDLARNYGYRIILFPGFEIASPVGKGAHFLCIFNPDSDLETIDSRLTQLDLPPDKRFGENGQCLPMPTGNITYERMLEIIQDDRSFPGICIGAHPNNDGVMDSDTVEQWWSQEVIRNENFFCMELPQPREDYIAKAGSSLIKSVLLNKDTRYERRRFLATVCSSDCKKLTATSQNDTNYIGFRHTWIKMSQPSVEALRQAFLDHESRIRFGTERPEEGYSYPNIRMIQVNAAKFLANQEIVFSPNLTTIIGGRGTGKSTIVEYLRVALDQEAAIRGDEPRKNLQKLKRTLQRKSSVTIQIEKEGKLWTLESAGGNPPLVTEGQDIPDLARFFPVRILSQREIYAIAEDRDARGRLVDDVIRSDLDELERRERDMSAEIRKLNQQIASLPELMQREKALETERQDYQLRLKRLKDMEKPLGRWKGLLAEERFFKAIEDQTTGISESMKKAFEDIEFSATVLGSELKEAPNHELTEAIARRADRLAEDLRENLEKALNAFDQGLKDLLNNEDVAKWRATFEIEKTKFEALRQELSGQGTDPDQYLDYQRQLREREVQLVEIRKRIKSIDELLQRRDGTTSKDGRHEPGLIDNLHDIWKKATELRAQASQQLTESVPETKTGEPFVKVSVERYGDKEGFLVKMQEEIQDGRRISLADWDDFMEAVFNAARQKEKPPTEMLVDWMKSIASGKMPVACNWQLDDRRMSVITEWLTNDRLQKLRLWRTPDLVKVELFRQDGSLVGDLAGPKLSVGQRCTAVLALLLAQDIVPVIIDQPEEDLDNEFVFQELVPLLRKIKEKRQILVVTHNANIPVNADAELIVAFEVKDERGAQKEVAQFGKAIGALDRPAVKTAVETIMEGSEEAFRRRFEKYGF
jgi:hypothetical protein